MERKVAIVGAGLSGLLACKYAAAKDLDPIVFEADEVVGGVWNNTIESTRLQNSKGTYEFADFPWPSSVEELCPSHSQVLSYLESYATLFDLFPYIKFNSKVIALDYVGVPDEEMESFELWGGTGRPFDSKGRWNVSVQNTRTGSTEVHRFEFVILCIGKFSGVPNIPSFPLGKGPEMFEGEVIHSMEYSAMDKQKAAQLIRGKRVAIVGSQKSAIDIASLCANANGKEYPCTMIQRTAHWQLPSLYFWGLRCDFLFFSRFAELLVHKPAQTFLHTVLASFLSPLRWATSKFAESYLKWKLPLKKYDIVPETSFLQSIASCQLASLPNDFYKNVDHGSIVLKKMSRSIGFCREGVIIDEESDHPMKVDLVILATGFRGDKKLQDLFKSPIFKASMVGLPGSIAPLYRHVIHPRIPQLAVIGFAESFSNLFTSEMRCQWLAQWLSGGFELPNIKDMEKDIKMWENSLELITNGQNLGASCTSSLHFWYKDQLCKDLWFNPKKK